MGQSFRRLVSVFDWCLTQGMHITGTKTPFDFLTAIARHSLEGVLHNLKQDVLLTEGEQDQIKNPRSKLRGIGGRKEADQKNAASCGEYVPKEIQRRMAVPHDGRARMCAFSHAAHLHGARRSRTTLPAWQLRSGTRGNRALAGRLLSGPAGRRSGFDATGNGARCHLTRGNRRGFARLLQWTLNDRMHHR